MSLKVEIKKKLRDMTLNVAFDTERDSGITGILGASGCGKSMTLKCIAGIFTPDEGRIELNGRVLFDSAKGIKRKNSGQGSRLSVSELCIVPPHDHTGKCGDGPVLP